jgi:hypothetical protein
MNSRIPYQKLTHQALPKSMQGYVSVNSKGKKSIFSRKLPPKSAKAYRATKTDLKEARRALESSGFQIVAESRLGFAIAGPSQAFEEICDGKVVTVDRLMHAEGGRERYVTHLDIVGDKQPSMLGHGTVKSSKIKIEGVLIERPRLLQSIFPSPIPPVVDQFHLRVPDDIAVGLGAIEAHRNGFAGEGTIVSMVDSGQYAHPFFSAHHYDVLPAKTVVTGTSSTKDPVGHGTGESANIFAIAPETKLQPIRATDEGGHLVGAIGGFLLAKQDSPTILTNSWGGDGPYPPVGPPDIYDIVWAAEIVDAIENGIFVVFSASNGGFTIEPQVPGVLAAGGVYMTGDLEMQASNYASGYPSPWFQNVTVPDVCGLVGLSPRAQYIMLPVQPGCELDVFESQPTPNDPNDDGTTANDGWALFSGTSAAAPQIAGIAALILSAKPGLSPAQITEAITNTATDIRTGRCHPRFNFPAEIGHDNATGHGLADASNAVQYAIDHF